MTFAKQQALIGLMSKRYNVLFVIGHWNCMCDYMWKYDSLCIIYILCNWLFIGLCFFRQRIGLSTGPPGATYDHVESIPLRINKQLPIREIVSFAARFVSTFVACELWLAKK